MNGLTSLQRCEVNTMWGVPGGAAGRRDGRGTCGELQHVVPPAGGRGLGAHHGAAEVSPFREGRSKGAGCSGACRCGSAKELQMGANIRHLHAGLLIRKNRASACRAACSKTCL